MSIELVGPPGIGKTVLWGWCVAAARAAGFRGLTAAPSTLGRTPYRGVADLLSDGLDSAASLSRLDADERRLLPGPLGRVNVAPPTTATFYWDAFRAIARQGPVLVAVDDVAGIDAESRRILDTLPRLLDGAGALILTAARTDEESLETVLSGGERVEVTPLSDGVLASIVGARIGQQLSRPVMAKVLRAARGNPLVALEVGAALARGDMSLGDTAPSRASTLLRRAVGTKLGQLSSDARRLVEAVAVAGQVSPRVLDAVSGVDSVSALQEALDLGVVEVVRGGVRVTHPVVATHVYAELAASRRRELHQALAAHLPDRVERARHLAVGTPIPDADVAVVLSSAAAEAAGRGAADAAADLADSALRLTPSDDPHRTARLLEASDAWFEAGDVNRSIELVEEELAEKSEGASLDLVVRLARGRGLRDGIPTAATLLNDALAAVTVADRSTVRARIELAMALGQYDVDAAQPVAARAVAEASQLEEPELLADAEDHLETLRMLSCGDAAVSVNERPLRMGQPLCGDQTRPGPRLLRRSIGVALRMKCAGDLESARTVLGAVRRDLEQAGGEGALPPVLFHLAELEAWAGRLDVASEVLEIGRMTTIRSAQQAIRSQVDYVDALVQALKGSVDAADDLARRGMQAAVQTSDPRQQIRHARIAGQIALARSHWRDAREILVPAADLATRCGFREPGFVRIDLDAIEALTACGDGAAARERAAGLASRAHYPWSAAAAALAKAMTLAGLGELRSAEAAAQQAADGFAGCRHPAEHARALLVKASAERRLRRHSAARASLTGARQVLADHGIHLWDDRLNAEGDHHARPGRGNTSALTPTEQRIAEAVSLGLTNREIAAMASISVKTVEANLSRIYAKLQVRSRTELTGKVLKSPRRT